MKYFTGGVAASPVFFLIIEQDRNCSRMKNARKSVFHIICDILVSDTVCLKSIDFIEVYRTGYQIREKYRL